MGKTFTMKPTITPKIFRGLEQNPAQEESDAITPIENEASYANSP